MFVACGIWCLINKVDMVCLSTVGYGVKLHNLVDPRMFLNLGRF